MKSKLLILAGILLFCQLSFSLSCMYRGYLKENNRVFYEHGKYKEEVKTADYKTFEVVDSLPHFDLLAKDKNNVYYQGKVIKGVNSKTFKIIKEFLPPDKGPWKYGCGSSGYIIEDKGIQYELKEIF